MSSDGALAVTADDGVRVIEVASGKTIATCGDCSRPGIYAVFSPDGTRVAVPTGETREMLDGDNTVVWDARSGKTLAKIPVGHVLAFSPDGAQLALHFEGA